MDCPACGAPTVRFPVPEAFTEHAPAAESPGEGADAVAVCTACLHVAPAETAPEHPDPTRVSDALPADPEAAVGVLLAVALLDALATNRPAIEALFAGVERRGADPVLALERLAEDPDVSPGVDLQRRRRQLAGFRS